MPSGGTAKWVGLGLVVAVASAALAYSLIGLVRHSGQRDEFGRVAIPGEHMVRLERGDVAVSYFEDVDLGENESLDVPADLDFTLRPAAGGPYLAERDPGLSSEEFANDHGTGRRVAELTVPRTADYRVSARGAHERRDPELLLGPDTAFLGSPPGIVMLGLVGAIVLGALGYVARTVLR